MYTFNTRRKKNADQTNKKIEKEEAEKIKRIVNPMEVFWLPKKKYTKNGNPFLS